MKQAVVVVSHPEGQEPLRNLLNSLKGLDYPLYVVINNAEDVNPAWLATLPGTVFTNKEVGYELGAIRTILERTDVGEFVLLQDTFEIKDLGVFDVVFEKPCSVAFGPTFFHYAGKWRREALARLPEIPRANGKGDSIRYEHEFSRLYWSKEEVWVLDPHFDDSEHQGFVEKFGRKNMLLENKWMKKYKGTWG